MVPPKSGPQALVLRWLDSPQLVEALPLLPAELFRSLLDALGLEEAGGLLAMATPQQFEQMTDDAWWDEEGDFDPAAFGTWLSLMLEGGEAHCVARLAELPLETVALGLHAQLHVLDVETFGLGMAGVSRHEAELVERALDASLYLEFGDYTLVARQPLYWDELITALTALDQHDHEFAEEILDACARASTEYLESREGLEGLQALLSAAETLDEDADAGREDRRADRGYVARSDARAFLRIDDSGCASLPERDAITAAYRRAAGKLAVQSPSAAADLASLPAELRAAIEAAQREGGTKASFAPSLESRAQRAFRAGLAALGPEASRERRWELAHLANLLVASGEHDPRSAAAEVLARCAEGYARLRGEGEGAADLESIGCDQLFRFGRKSPLSAST